jgi:hypothetical protein
MTLTQIAGTDQTCYIYHNGPSKGELIADKLFCKFAIPPALRGQSIVQALFNLYVSASGDYTTALGVATTTGAWNGSSTYANLRALSLANLSSVTIPTTTGVWVPFDVTGDATKGFKEACASGRSELTVVLTYLAGTPLYRAEGFMIGYAQGFGDDDTHHFDYRAFDFAGGTPGVNVPNVYITAANEGGPGTNPGDEGLALYAGVVA